MKKLDKIQNVHERYEAFLAGAEQMRNGTFADGIQNVFLVNRESIYWKIWSHKG